MNTKTIKVDYLARVEGEGALYVKIRGDKITDVKFKIFEPPRLSLSSSIRPWASNRALRSTCMRLSASTEMMTSDILKIRKLKAEN